MARVRVATSPSSSPSPPHLLLERREGAQRCFVFPCLFPQSVPSLPKHRGGLVEVACSHNVFRCSARRIIFQYRTTSVLGRIKGVRLDRNKRVWIGNVSSETQRRRVRFGPLDQTNNNSSQRRLTTRTAKTRKPKDV